MDVEPTSPPTKDDAMTPATPASRQSSAVHSMHALPASRHG